MVGKPGLHLLFAIALLQRGPDLTVVFRDAGHMKSVDGGDLGLAQSYCRQTAGSLFGVLEAILEHGYAALHGGDWIVEFVGQTRGEFTERDYLFVVQIAGGKKPGAIEHHMNQGRCDFATLARHRPETVAGDLQKFGWFQGDHISWRSHQAGIWQYAKDVACMPLKGFVRPGAAIDEHSHSSGKNDVKALHWLILGTQHFARIQPEHGSVGYQPLELRPGRCS